MVLRLERLPLNIPISDKNGRPQTAFSRWWDQALTQIEDNLNHVTNAADAADAAQAAADAAQASANAAQAAADAAQAAADAAQADVDALTATVAANEKLKNLQISGVSADTTIMSDVPGGGGGLSVTVSNHRRIYGDGTSVAVTGSTATGLPLGSEIFIYYDDSSRAGGAVIYQGSLTSDNAQASTLHPDRHFVGFAAAMSTPGPALAGRPNFWGF